MKSRERVIRALEFKGPDRIPLFLALKPWDTDIVAALFFPARGYHVNERFMTRSPATYIVQRVRKGPFYQMDEFGSIWYNPGNETIGQVVDPRVIKTWNDLKDYKNPPKTDKGRWWLAKFIFRVFGKNRYRMGSLDNFFFERLHFLRGFSNVLKDLKRNTEKVKALLEKLSDWYCWLVDRWAELGAGGIIATDDWGTNHGPFISPRDFDEIMKPVYQTVTERIHDYGMHFILHSCGNIYYLIPKLIEAGVDCLQLDSPGLTGVNKLRDFCGKVAYMCVADIDRVIPYKTPREVEARVFHFIKLLGRFNGGLLGTVYADLAALNFPRENMEASVRAYKRWGKYGEYPLI